MRNVLSNAIKFTPPGGDVSVSVRDANDRLAVEVSDTGIGIPAESQSEIFKEYVQLGNPERDRQKGLGLGLSIVRRLCDLLKIDFELKSAQSSGTSFTFNLPKSTRQDLDDCSAPDRFAALRIGVLVIDDERAIIDSMSIVLSDWGCEVFCAQSAEEATGLITTLDLSPDVIIADMRLRGDSTGLSVISDIRALVKKDIPAMIMTGNVDGLGDHKLPSHSILLAKPVEAATLYRELKNLRSIEHSVSVEKPAEVHPGSIAG
ncbi:MAG: response regulator [Hyphomicrobiales bacterium]|nr:response regulator [Hyphomicrobiales bacterium]